jgi:GAF domain-containing protein
MKSFETLYDQLANTLPTDPVAAIQHLLQNLYTEVPHYNWVGIYWAAGNRTLRLGPFFGAPTDHVLIPYGTGICGQAAETLETFVVDDVSTAGNYLACSLEVKSEIVIPLFRSGEFIGELDIDSHTVAAFTPDDQAFLERIARLLETYATANVRA